MDQKNKIKFLAYYLPQYHQIPENDEWWGEGFTEWTNVRKAKPLFKGHQQPVIPGELGYYDLMKTEGIQEKQAALAKEYGIDGFIYYSYWFGNGKMLLEKPAEKMLANKNVDIPFCFCWANETWRGIWHGIDNENTILMEQTYPGRRDYEEYFNYLLPFFRDERYIKIDGKIMFHIYRSDDIPDWSIFAETFETLAKQSGLNGMYFITTGNTTSAAVLSDPRIKGVVGLDLFSKLRYSQQMFFSDKSRWFPYEKLLRTKLGMLKPLTERTKPVVLDYKKGTERLIMEFPHPKYIPSAIPNWDNSARSYKRSLILKNSSPESFKKYLSKIVMMLQQSNEIEHKIIVIKSWNEWAEGNHLEPDAKFGRKWLQVIRNFK